MGDPRPIRPRRFSLAILLTSVLLFVLGCLFIGLTIALSPTDFMKASRSTLHSVFWFGCLIVLTATVGVVAGTRQRRCPAVSLLIVSILSSVASALVIFVLVVMSVGNLSLGITCLDADKTDCRQGLNITYVIGLVACSVLCLGCSVMSAVLACRSVCRCCGAVADSRDSTDDLELTPATPVIPIGYISTPQENLRVPRLAVPSGMYGSSTEELPLYKPHHDEDSEEGETDDHITDM